MGKPVKESVAIAIEHGGQLLVVRRSDDDASLPGVWGLPGASLKPGESSEDAAVRAGLEKLGVHVEIVAEVGQDQIDRGLHVTHLREYRVRIVAGEPSVPQPDTSVSQYVDLRYTENCSILFEAARKGSLCSRIYLASRKIDWTTG